MAYAQQKSGMTRGKYDPVTGRAGHAHDGATAQAGRELVATVLAGYQVPSLFACGMVNWSRGRRMHPASCSSGNPLHCVN